MFFFWGATMCGYPAKKNPFIAGLTLPLRRSSIRRVGGVTGDHGAVHSQIYLWDNYCVCIYIYKYIKCILKGWIKLGVGARHSFQSNLVVMWAATGCMQETDCATSIGRRCATSAVFCHSKRPGLQQHMITYAPHHTQRQKKQKSS